MNTKKLLIPSLGTLLAYALLMLCLTPFQLSAQCPDEIEGFDFLGEFEDHKYYLSQDELLWIEASDMANALGGYLAAINNQEENDFLFENALALNLTMSAFIGLNDYDIEGSLVWSNGEPVTFLFLNPDISNSEDNDGASLDIWNMGGEWSLRSTFNSQKYIVELPCDEILPDANVQMVDHECPEAFPTPGNTINFTVTVENQGDEISPPQTFGFYQSRTSNNPISDFLMGQTTVDELAPGETAIISFENIQISDPFYFPSFIVDNVQWGSFYVKAFDNPTGTSLSPESPNQIFDFYCQQYITDLEVDINTNSYEYGDAGQVSYGGVIRNLGPSTAYNIRTEVARMIDGPPASVTSIPFHTQMTIDNSEQTKLIYIDELGPGETVEFTVFYELNTTNIPATFDVSASIFSEHLVDVNGLNNTITKTFVFNPNVSDDCPDNIEGFQFIGQFNSNRYFISNTAVHWWEADSIALEAGGELTEIETSTENIWVFDHLDENVWIGLSDHEEEGTFVWSNDVPVTYSNLQGTNDPTLDYVSINFFNGAWVLNKPVVQHKFVIEVPCNIVPGSFVDLTASEITYPELSIEQLEADTFSFTLSNNGNSDAANEFIIRFYLSKDTLLDLGDAEVGQLKTGFWGSNYSEHIEAPDGIAVPWNLLLGDYYIILHVDNNDIGLSDIEESNELNNIIVSEQTIEVTGNLCTISPDVTDGDLTVVGIPEGNSVFVLYNAASQIEEMFFCNYDCFGEIEVDNLDDGDYAISFNYYNDNWELICSNFPLTFSVEFGEILTPLVGNSDTEIQIFNDPLKLITIKDQTAYPNPAEDYIITTIESLFETDAQIEVYDINGRLSIAQSIHLNKGFQSFELDIQQLTRGVHNIVLKSDGVIISTHKFVKH